MSGALIVKGSVPGLLAFFGWQRARRVQLRATIGASGAPTVVSADTTPGLSLARNSPGVYTLSFPPCRRLGLAPSVAVKPDDATDVADHRVASIDKDNTSASGGTLRIHCASFDGTEQADEEVVSGSEICAEFWIDL